MAYSLTVQPRSASYPVGEVRRGEFGWCLFAADLPEPTAQKSDDFPLNLRIIQQTQ